jgi:hypothetical protein
MNKKINKKAEPGRYVSIFHKAIGSSEGIKVPRKRFIECCFSASVNEFE